MRSINRIITIPWFIFSAACISIACTSGCNRIVLEDPKGSTMQPLRVLTGHKGYITSLLFLNQEELASASLDRSIKIWDITRGAELYSLKDHKKQIVSLALSSDRKHLASGGIGEGAIIWAKDSSGRLRFQQRIHTLPYVTSLAFSPDKQVLAIGEGVVHGNIHLFNIETRANRSILKTDSMIECLALSPNNEKLVVGCSDSTLLFYDIINHKCERSVKEHFTDNGEGVFCVAFSPAGKIVATSGFDQTVRIWDVSRSKELFALTGHNQIVKSISFSPDGRLLATGAGEGYLESGELKIWDLRSQKELSSFSAHSKPIRVVSFSPDGKLLATGSEDNTVKIWETSKLLATPTEKEKGRD